MDRISIDPEPTSTSRRVQRRPERVPATGNNPYSPLLCLSLLLAIGLIIVGH